MSRKRARAPSRVILERYTHREFGELAAAVESLSAIGVPVAGLGEAGELSRYERLADPAELG